MIDIMEALKQSLLIAKKPAGIAEVTQIDEAAAAEPGKRTRGGRGSGERRVEGSEEKARTTANKLPTERGSRGIGGAIG